MSYQFDTLLTSLLPRLTRFAMTLTRNRSDADDLVQSTALLAVRYQAGFVVGTNFQAWIFRIMKNKFLDTCRSNKRRPDSLEDAPPNTLARGNQIYEQVLTKEITKTIGKLAPLLRDAMVMVCSHGLSYEEVARAQSCSEGTIKSRLWRAREKMRALLGLGGDANTPYLTEEFAV